MQKANVKVGQFVEQGDVIGFVGVTGYTSGPHVCYRFWKDGREVDPFKQKLPEAKPINESLKQKYLNDIVLIKSKIDSIIIKNIVLGFYSYNLDKILNSPIFYLHTVLIN